MKKDYAEYLLNKTKEDYNLIAEEFSRTRENIWPEIKFLFDEHVVKDDKVLDLGCGNGRYYSMLQNKEVLYTGVDNSEKLIELAKNKYPGVEFKTADALSLPSPDNYFDKIYSIAVLHHIPSKELRLQFLKEAKRVLKQKGLLILTLWKFHERGEIFLLIKYTILKILGKSKLDFKDILEPWGKKTERYYHWFSIKEARRLLEEAGFEVKKTGIAKNEKGNRRNIYIIAEK
jgi:ubiquinone/menaquinone biosynthesis C-methylase UbiE